MCNNTSKRCLNTKYRILYNKVFQIEIQNTVFIQHFQYNIQNIELCFVF